MISRIFLVFLELSYVKYARHFSGVWGVHLNVLRISMLSVPTIFLNVVRNFYDGVVLCSFHFIIESFFTACF